MRLRLVVPKKVASSCSSTRAPSLAAADRHTCLIGCYEAQPESNPNIDARKVSPVPHPSGRFACVVSCIERSETAAAARSGSVGDGSRPRPCRLASVAVRASGNCSRGCSTRRARSTEAALASAAADRDRPIDVRRVADDNLKRRRPAHPRGPSCIWKVERSSAQFAPRRSSTAGIVRKTSDRSATMLRPRA